MRRWIGAGWLLIFAVRCSASGEHLDAGSPMPADAGTFEPSAVMSPLPPELRPCPREWVEVQTDDGRVECDPWRGTVTSTCAPNETRYVGGPACERIGSVCPADGWPADLPVDRPVIYVRAGATLGSGTQTSPYGTLARALEAVPEGGVVAMAPGTYAEWAQIRKPVELRGACASDTVIESDASIDRHVIQVLGASVAVTLRDLTLRGERQGLYVGSATRTTLQDVIVGPTVGSGISVVFEAELDGEGVVMRDLRGNGIEDAPEAALVILGGAAHLHRSVIERSVGAGVIANGPTSLLTLTDVVVRDTQSRPSFQNLGRAMNVDQGARAELNGVVLERNRELGIFVFAAELDASHLLVRDTLPTEGDRSGGDGVIVFSGGRARITASVIENNRATGITAFGFDSEVALEDVVVRNTKEDALLSVEGRGFQALHGATGRMERVLVERSPEVGVLVLGAAAWLDATDLLVRDNQGRPSDGLGGIGLASQHGAYTELARARFERMRDASLLAIGAGTTLIASDLVVTETRERACAETTCEHFPSGLALSALGEGYASIQRFRVSKSHLVGLQVARGGTMDAVDGIVEDNPIGANVQTEGFDLSRIARNVLYRNNDRALDASAAFVPEATFELPDDQR